MNRLPCVDPSNMLFELELSQPEVVMRGEPRGAKANIRLSCGVPVATNLFAEFADWGQKVPFEIRSQADCYDFWLVQMVFTLAVERGYTLDWMELGVKLTHPGRVPSTAVVASRRVQPGPVQDETEVEPPIAYDLYPQRIADKVDVEKKLTVGPRLEFEKVKVGLGEAGLTVKHTEPVPTVVGYNKRQPDPYWRFDKGRSRGVEPGIKEMKLIVRSHRNRPTRAAVWVNGHGRGFLLTEKMAPPARREFYF